MSKCQQDFILHLNRCHRLGCEPSDWQTWEREWRAVEQVERTEPAPASPATGDGYETRNYSLTTYAGEGIRRRAKRGTGFEDERQ